MRKDKGFTLVEMSIAMGLLSLLFIGAFSVFSDSNKAFNAGTWRLNRQKEAQRFLLFFKEHIEKASHAYTLKSDGSKILIRNIDISVASTYFNTLASSTNSGILFASSCTPIQEPNPELGIEKIVEGIWKGYSLECFNQKLAFVQTGDVNKMLSSTPSASLAPSNPNIKLGDTIGDTMMVLEDVDSIGVFVKESEDSITLKRPEVLLTLKIVMAMPGSKGRTTVTEEITAKIQDRTLSQVVKGAANYSIQSTRK